MIAMTKWSSDWRVALQPGVTMTESNGEVLFFDETNEQVFGVDGPVAEALLLLDRGSSLGQAVGALLDVYDVDEETLARDVTTVLETLATHALLRPVAPVSCAPA